jgi:hypothetical protein
MCIHCCLVCQPCQRCITQGHLGLSAVSEVSAVIWCAYTCPPANTLLCHHTPDCPPLKCRPRLFPLCWPCIRVRECEPSFSLCWPCRPSASCAFKGTSSSPGYQHLWWGWSRWPPCTVTSAGQGHGQHRTGYMSTWLSCAGFTSRIVHCITFSQHIKGGMLEEGQWTVKLYNSAGHRQHRTHIGRQGQHMTHISGWQPGTESFGKSFPAAGGVPIEGPWTAVVSLPQLQGCWCREQMHGIMALLQPILWHADQAGQAKTQCCPAVVPTPRG